MSDPPRNVPLIIVSKKVSKDWVSLDLANILSLGLGLTLGRTQDA